MNKVELFFPIVFLVFKVEFDFIPRLREIFPQLYLKRFSRQQIDTLVMVASHYGFRNSIQIVYFHSKSH